MENVRAAEGVSRTHPDAVDVTDARSSRTLSYSFSIACQSAENTDLVFAAEQQSLSDIRDPGQLDPAGNVNSATLARLAPNKNSHSPNSVLQ